MILSSVWVEPNSSAAGTRMLQIIKLFQDQDFEVHYASTAAASPFAFNLDVLGIFSHTIALNNSSFDVFIKDLDPHIVVFDRFMVEEQFGWRVLLQCPNATRVLDTEDLHFLRLARQAAYKQNREFLFTDLYNEGAKREVASILRCDLTLMISEVEVDILVNQFNVPESHLIYLPFLWEEEPLPTKNFEARKDFVFIGNFIHEPNWATVQVLKEKVWPLLKKAVPEASLQVYGAYPTQKVEQLHKPSDRFYINGRADNAYNVIQDAKALLAPIPFGAGIKGKLYEAMLLGTPSVTSVVGAEAMPGELSWNGFITNDIEEFVKHATTLYYNPEIWQKSQQNGYKIIEQRFKSQIFKPVFLNRIKDITHNLAIHRQSNFMGEILNYHTFRSTEFMSRWIEEKNKK